MSTIRAIYCQHIWGDQMSGSDGAFRVCKAACHASWMDGTPEPQVQIGKIETSDEVSVSAPPLDKQTHVG